MIKHYEPVAGDYTLLQALAELYSYDPKKTKKALVFKLSVDGKDCIVFGKGWDRLFKCAAYFEGEPSISFESTEKHFVSNLMCTISQHFHCAIYSAQQGDFEVTKYLEQ